MADSKSPLTKEEIEIAFQKNFLHLLRSKLNLSIDEFNTRGITPEDKQKLKSDVLAEFKAAADADPKITAAKESLDQGQRTLKLAKHLKFVKKMVPLRGGGAKEIKTGHPILNTTLALIGKHFEALGNKEMKLQEGNLPADVAKAVEFADKFSQKSTESIIQAAEAADDAIESSGDVVELGQDARSELEQTWQKVFFEKLGIEVPEGLLSPIRTEISRGPAKPKVTYVENPPDQPQGIYQKNQDGSLQMIQPSTLESHEKIMGSSRGPVVIPKEFMEYRGMIVLESDIEQLNPMNPTPFCLKAEKQIKSRYGNKYINEDGMPSCPAPLCLRELPQGDLAQIYEKHDDGLYYRKSVINAIKSKPEATTTPTTNQVRIALTPNVATTAAPRNRAVIREPGMPPRTPKPATAPAASKSAAPRNPEAGPPSPSSPRVSPSQPEVKPTTIDQGEISPENANSSAKSENLRQVLERGICKAFFGKTDGIDSMSWDNVRTRLTNMTLVEARRIWQTIANEMATNCFDDKGNVDVEKLKILKELLKDAENFKSVPFCYIPHVEFVRSHMHTVCECLILNKNGARDLLNSAKNIVVGKYGQSILKATSDPVLGAAVAILASLYVPNRQSGMPTCTINSTINAETRNHPERPIKMYIQMLSKDQITFPSGYAVSLQPIVDGCITVDLKNGGAGKDAVFEDIVSGDPVKIANRKQRWHNAGIEYNPAENYKLRLSVHNMNDILYAHLLQASNFGNKNIKNDGHFGTALVYAGYEDARAISLQIPVDGSNFLDGMAKLKEQAEAQQKLEHCYMRVGTKSSNSAHAENIDIAALLALDPDSMKPGNAYPIGDRNWKSEDMSQDIPRLAIRKVKGTPPTFEFGTLRGSRFEKTDMRSFEIYRTNISTINYAPATPPSPSSPRVSPSQPEVKPTTTQAPGLRNPGIDKGLSATMCDNLRRAFTNKLPQLTAGDDPFTKESIEFTFQDQTTWLPYLAKDTLGLTSDEFNIRNITPEDMQKLKTDLLEEFDRHAKS
jgi:hypothetical protein